MLFHTSVSKSWLSGLDPGPGSREHGRDGLGNPTLASVLGRSLNRYYRPGHHLALPSQQACVNKHPTLSRASTESCNVIVPDYQMCLVTRYGGLVKKYFNDANIFFLGTLTRPQFDNVVLHLLSQVYLYTLTYKNNSHPMGLKSTFCEMIYCKYYRSI